MSARPGSVLSSPDCDGPVYDYDTTVRPLCVKMALICKNRLKVRVRIRVRVRNRVSVSSLYRQGPHFYR